MFLKKLHGRNYLYDETDKYIRPATKSDEKLIGLLQLGEEAKRILGQFGEKSKEFSNAIEILYSEFMKYFERNIPLEKKLEIGKEIAKQVAEKREETARKEFAPKPVLMDDVLEGKFIGCAQKIKWRQEYEKGQKLRKFLKGDA